MRIASAIKHIAFLGDHLPRQCGIATFTSNVCEAVAAEFPECLCVVGAVNDRPEGYDYPARVRFEIDEKELDSYRLRPISSTSATSKSFQSSTSLAFMAGLPEAIFWLFCAT